ncbi:Protein of unknown function (DUF674 [Striga hermonthica]|uniref:Uncharacterized protein n=1 Tax=Striga hermonthica TaxID=68872 RepID=A0A9N7ML94_STRHE|nr:Protein of unknown function (DUF674 [Striga hermonthica]
MLSFLTLPLGKIAKIVMKRYGDNKPVFGSLTALYSGLVNIDDVHFHTEAGKQMLLNLRSVFYKECRKLKLNLCDSEPTNDDVRVALAGSVLRALAELGIRDIKGAEMRKVTFGHSEASPDSIVIS